MSDKYCVLQDDLKDCGVCALLSIIKYYNGDVSREYLKELTKTTRNGVSALNLSKAAREMGFESYGIKGKLKDIKKEYLPIIAHVTIDKKFNHFVVIYKIDMNKNQILIMDPAKGFVSMSFSSFMNITTNYYIVLKMKQFIPKLVEDNNFYNQIKLFMKKYWLIWVIVFIMSTLYMIVNIVSSYNFQLLFDEVLITNDSDLKIIFYILVFLIFLKLLINLFRNNLISILNYVIDKYIITNAYNHIINLPYLYYKNHTNGDLLTRINDLGNIKELISNLFITIFVDFFLAIVILFFMVKINVTLTIIAMISLTLYSLICLVYNKTYSKSIRDSYEKTSLVNNFIVESLASFETIKNLSLQKYILNKFTEVYSNFASIEKKIISKVNCEKFFKNFVLLTGNIIIMYLGISYLKNNSIKVSMLVTFITLTNYLFEPIKNILDLNILYQNTKESIRRIKEIYNIPKENLLNDLKKDIKILNGQIDVNDLCYSYNGSDMILNHLSFNIQSKEKVLICGESGSGKSTLIKLLIKYLDMNYTGDINIGGYDLKKISINSLRNNICYVSQNEYLYTNTVYENITLGKKINYKKFLNIAKGVHIDEIVKNSSLNYNYLIENNGENISGGEKMRIMIARSLFKKANIYIYDETFSAIDVKMEKDILNYLFSLMPNKTIIVISHRQSNLELFNRCIMIGDVHA